ncbi:thioesterase family protein [Kitasatospora sp. NBC_01250]|uniref:thioesterase family protein n=1 Tax=unclassified Kitasatospora TaxID=2633591 RepID=UPI002E12A1AE|nr:MULTISPECIES: thioesterase family protein [unclassified Kitasatospora]WSJ66020.1 thioesterase family protein [Kitasatospora sp. NBC_01302]
MTTATRTDSEFDQAIALEPDPGTPGRHRGELGAGWQIGGGVNGGLLLAVAANALRQELPEHPDPLSISGYYLETSHPGPLTALTSTVRRGRSLSTATASLYQDGADGTPVEKLRVLASYGELAALTGEVHTSAVPPQLPPVEQCVGMEHAPPALLEQAALLERFDLRLDPATVGWALGQPAGAGRIQGWFRLADGREPDPLALLLVADALPPVTFDLGLPGWAPTVELTVHLRAVPAAGWLRVSHATRNLAGGYFEEDCEIWDSADRLVAQSRQLARAPRGRA